MRFPVIADLHSPHQLRDALYAANAIANALLACALEQTLPTPELLRAVSQLNATATDAKLIERQ